MQCDGEYEIELGVISDAVGMVRELAAQYGDLNRYSDGRVVKSEAEITYGFYTDHVWHPDPNAETCHSWSGALHSDPGVPSPGFYTVTMHVEVVHGDNVVDFSSRRRAKDESVIHTSGEDLL
ncbi:hypothetical protein [Mycobacterium intracellulare]|uniref:Uncharacterized protein n=1 Tax=Mycobacterium intracellulare subsp. chimaera TaxID=222805 RepID=A0ABT7P8G1_MYCIT|nr:hypothetical protein [Mycobacterium intracellulare]ASQ87356.1 hypothetical protein CE197_18545 [Mycobacterium intracellulare subsp. chimaera]MCF1814934.1 hypothetical protein [Mycobacterium intracellulare subsp. intracellulare]MDM3929575.1 hypothetical protein [Mycobacterium intracellulare subsp. chimaera]MDS0336860.1 hypothetical protein [Mycobacterium intracellulare]